jgi:pimeloyl-ACP methyl ester carboxylesterase
LQKSYSLGSYFNYHGGRIHFTDLGKGSVIVLIHGYLESLKVWENFARKLSEDFRVVSVDLPGHGKSDIYGEIHTMDFFAGVLSKLLEYLDIPKAFLTGHSLGGYVTLAFADIYPQKLFGYCLFHSHPFADSPEALKKRDREIKFVKAGKKDLMYPENVSKMFAETNLDKFKTEFLRSKQIASEISGEGIIAVLNGMMIRPSRLSVMEDGRVPCLWVLGLMDNYIKSDTIILKVNLPQNAEVVILKNSGHMGFVEEEALSAIVITDFVKQITYSDNR